MKRTMVSATGFAALVLGVSGCAKDRPAETPAPTTSANSPATTPVKIAFIPKGNSNSFWQVMKQGADKAAAEDKNVTVAWQPPGTENDIVAQINMLQTQVTGGTAGIALVATDAQALVKPVDDAIAKGIPVVTVDSGIGKDSAACYIATDNVEGGRMAAKSLAEAIGDKGTVGILFFLKGAVSNDEREQGFKEEMAKHPGIKIVAELQAKDAADALSKSSNMFTANPGLTGIFANNEPLGIGAANYIRQNKLTGKAQMVAFDAATDEVNGLKDGTIHALIVQDPYQMGYLGVQTLLKAVRKQPIEKKFVDSGVTLVTKANMDTPPIQKLLDPTKR